MNGTIKVTRDEQLVDKKRKHGTTVRLPLSQKVDDIGEKVLEICLQNIQQWQWNHALQHSPHFIIEWMRFKSVH